MIPPALLWGKGRHCPRHLLRSSSFPHLRVAGGSALPQEARHAGLGDDLAWDRAALEDTWGRPRRWADWGLPCGRAVDDSASRQGKMCWMASVCFRTAENCWAQSSTVLPKSIAWETGASTKRTLSTSLVSNRLSHRWCSWTTSVDITFPKERTVTSVAHGARSVAECSFCINLESVLPWWILMPWLGVLAG